LALCPKQSVKRLSAQLNLGDSSTHRITPEDVNSFHAEFKCSKLFFGPIKPGDFSSAVTLRRFWTTVQQYTKAQGLELNPVFI
jgi:hypothetical protein